MSNTSVSIYYIGLTIVINAIWYIVLSKEKAAFKQILRATNEAWREYERKTVKLYQLIGEADMLHRIIRFWQKHIKDLESAGELQLGTLQEGTFLLRYEASQFELKVNDLKLPCPYMSESLDTISQWLVNVISESRNQIQAIYDEHNKGGLLQRKER